MTISCIRIRKSVMAVWSKVAQWHEMFCHDPEVLSSNPGQVKLGGA